MPFDPTQVRDGERIYMTQDCWDALNLVVPRSEKRDKFIEDAVWEALAKYPGLIDCINERRESLSRFREHMKATMEAAEKDDE